MEIGKDQSGMVVERQPGKGRRDWLEALQPRIGSTEAGVTSALLGSARDTLSHEQGICSWSHCSCAHTAFLTRKMPSLRDGPHRAL